MLTKRTTDVPRIPLSPAMTFCLMTGAEPTARLRGWVALAHAGLYGQPSVEAVWMQHRAAIVAEAAVYGFEPYALIDRTPRGAGFQRWREAFLATPVD